jgi:hypothetical protein
MVLQIARGWTQWAPGAGDCSGDVLIADGAAGGAMQSWLVCKNYTVWLFDTLSGTIRVVFDSKPRKMNSLENLSHCSHCSHLKGPAAAGPGNPQVRRFIIPSRKPRTAALLRWQRSERRTESGRRCARPWRGPAEAMASAYRTSHLQWARYALPRSSGSQS